MKIGQKGIDLIKFFEGCRLEAYLCPAGVPTIGYGRTTGVKLGMKITQQQATEYLKQDLQIYENHVNRIVDLPLNQNQFDALVSFCYNCGQGNLQKLVKGRNHEQIAKTMLLYNKANGKVLKGLKTRRQMEQKLFLTPDINFGNEVQVMAGGLNVRSGAGIKNKIVDVLNKNEIVRVYEVSGDWGNIGKGWINLKYTKKV